MPASASELKVSRLFSARCHFGGNELVYKEEACRNWSAESTTPSLLLYVVDYVCEAYNNPPDFFLDILNGSVAVTATVNGAEKTKIPNGQSAVSAAISHNIL